MDDEVLVLGLLADALVDAGYAVTTALGDEEALEALQTHLGELGGLVTDVNLGAGRKSGWDIANQARALNPDVAVVYVTGDSGHNWTTHSVPRSCLLEKPFAATDVVRALEAALTKVWTGWSGRFPPFEKARD